MPQAPTVTYQWQSSTTSAGTYAAVSGAITSTYTPVTADVGKYIEVVATGTGSYPGTAISMAVGPIAPKTLSSANTKTSSATSLTWSAANTYCTNLTTGGFTWRLPTENELLNAMTNQFVYGGSNPGGFQLYVYYWSSTPNALNQAGYNMTVANEGGGPAQRE